MSFLKSLIPCSIQSQTASSTNKEVGFIHPAKSIHNYFQFNKISEKPWLNYIYFGCSTCTNVGRPCGQFHGDCILVSFFTTSLISFNYNSVPIIIDPLHAWEATIFFIPGISISWIDLPSLSQCRILRKASSPNVLLL